MKREMCFCVRRKSHSVVEFNRKKVTDRARTVFWAPSASYPTDNKACSLGLKLPDREADHSLPYSAEVNNAWSYECTLTPPYVLIQGRDNLNCTWYQWFSDTEMSRTTTDKITYKFVQPPTNLGLFVKNAVLFIVPSPYQAVW
jgi:hypothetical protein